MPRPAEARAARSGSSRVAPVTDPASQFHARCYADRPLRSRESETSRTTRRVELDSGAKDTRRPRVVYRPRPYSAACRHLPCPHTHQLSLALEPERSPDGRVRVHPAHPPRQGGNGHPVVRGVQERGKDAFEAWHRSHGVRRHAVWHQQTPNGTVAIVLLEGDDIEAALRGTATSEEPFDQQFRNSVKDVHGVDLAKDPPPEVVQLIDWKAS
jgi:hypothetical protein